MSDFFSPERLPAISVAALFLGALLASVFCRNRTLRSGFALLAVSCSLACLIALVRPVMLGGEVVICRSGGMADGIALEVDALSLFFALLAAAAAFIACVWAVPYTAQENFPQFFPLFLILAGGVLGFVLSGDLLSMFLLLETASLAAAAHTAAHSRVRGAPEAAFRALAVGGMGSVCLLTGVVLLYANTRTLSFARLCTVIPGLTGSASVKIAFAQLLVGFALKACLVPFHPLAADHAAAPAPAAAMSSGVLTLGGIYGIVRLTYFLFQKMDLSAFQSLLVFTGSVSVILCAALSLFQQDLGRILAFHAVSRVGAVLLAFGLHTTAGFPAGLFHALNHVFISALLFLSAGAVLRERGTLSLDSLGGLGRKMPRTAALFLIGAFSAAGIPPLSGFASGWMIFQECCKKAVESGRIGFLLAAVLCFAASVLTLASFIRVSRVFFGRLPERPEEGNEASTGMLLAMGVPAALCVLTGLFPDTVCRFLTRPAAAAAFNVEKYIDSMLGAGAASEAFGPFVAAAQNLVFDRAGIWSPLAWLLLFCIALLAAVLAAAVFRYDRRKAPGVPEDDGEVPPSAGGEEAAGQAVSPDPPGDLMNVWKPFSGFPERFSGGVLHDDALWAAVAVALALLFSMVEL